MVDRCDGSGGKLEEPVEGGFFCIPGYLVDRGIEVTVGDGRVPTLFTMADQRRRRIETL